MDSAQAQFWNRLVPVSGNGCDISVQWSDPRQGAQEIHKGCIAASTIDDGKVSDDEDIVCSLESLLSEFRRIALMIEPHCEGFRARVVSSRGTAGTRCPLWHCDYVPVRWIQSLVGPGCEYVASEQGVDRWLLNQWAGGDEDDRIINNRRVRPGVADIRSGDTGAAVVLRGRDSTKLPCIHKSPVLSPGEGRVLLTLDIDH